MTVGEVVWLRRLTIGVTLVIAVVGLIAASATSASAHPTYTMACNGCHSGTNVPVTATLASTTGSTATYDVSATGASAIAVFDGSTKVATINAASGQFSVAVGKTYTVFAVKGPSTSNGIGSTSVSPAAAPPPDTTAPSTSSDAKPTYTTSATIKLVPTDNVGGSGVAHTYYVLDSAAQAEGSSITTSALGSHTLEFWSVDVAGNAEAHKSVTFSVSAPDPSGVATSALTIRTSAYRMRHHRTVSLSGMLTPAGSGGDPVVIYVKKPGSTEWVAAASVTTRRLHMESDDEEEEGGHVATGSSWYYSFTPTTRGAYQFQARFAGDDTRAPSVSAIVSMYIR